MTAVEAGRAAAGDLPGEAGTVVIGGGIVGSCSSGFLAEEGVDVVLVDEGQGGGSAANAGSLHVQMQSRFMRLYPQHVQRMEQQLPLYPKAVDFWTRFAGGLGAPIELKVTGGLMVAEDREQFEFLARKAARERELGLDVHMLDRTELDRFAPYLGPAVVGAELCTTEGKVNPLLCNAAIRDWLIPSGVGLADRVAATAVRQARTGYEIETSRGTLRAGRVVLAAGAGVTALAAGLGLSIPARPEPLHMNITEAVPPLLGHLVQHADRMITLKQLGTGQVVIGGGWPARMAGPGFVEVELASLIGNATLAQHVVPELATARIIRTWAGVNTSVDGLGVLGPVSSHPGLFVAIPGDAGYTLGPLSARLVADTILGRDPAEDIRPYAPERLI